MEGVACHAHARSPRGLLAHLPTRPSRPLHFPTPRNPRPARPVDSTAALARRLRATFRGTRSATHFSACSSWRRARPTRPRRTCCSRAWAAPSRPSSSHPWCAARHAAEPPDPHALAHARRARACARAHARRRLALAVSCPSHLPGAHARVRISPALPARASAPPSGRGQDPADDAVRVRRGAILRSLLHDRARAQGRGEGGAQPRAECARPHALAARRAAAARLRPAPHALATALRLCLPPRARVPQGVGALFRGVLPRTIYLAPLAALVYACYEEFKRLIIKFKADKAAAA